MDCNLDLEKVAKATVMKDSFSAAAAIGTAVLETAEVAAHMFKGSLGLDITDFVIEKVNEAKTAEPLKVEIVHTKAIHEELKEALREKAKVVAGLKPTGDKPKRRGRPSKKLSAGKEG
jgi:hypothetical protein